MGNASRVRSKLQSIRNDQEVIPYVLFFVILIVHGERVGAVRSVE